MANEIVRKSHIHRIYKDDDPTNDQWIDIERIDELRYISHSRYPRRERVWRFDWEDFDPKGLDIDGKPIPKKRIQDPTDDSNPNDANASVIEVPVRAVVYVTTAKKQQFQAYKHYFINDDSNTTRETHSRRIYHHDITSESLDQGGNPPRDPETYLNALGDQDSGQYLDVEILDKYWSKERESRDTHGHIKPGNWQEKKWVLDAVTDRLLREPLLDDDVAGGEPGFVPTSNPSSGAGGDVAGTVKIDPPWRLDPLQNIVNVNWGGLAVIFGPESADAPSQKKKQDT